MASHKYFEELSALAAAGELDGQEMLALNEHLSVCDSCRAASSEFSRIVHSDLPVLHDESLPWPQKVRQVFRTNGYTERFMSRAAVAGIHFSWPLERNNPIVALFRLAPRYALIAASIMAILSAAVVARREFKKFLGKSTQSAELERKLEAVGEHQHELERALAASAGVIKDLRSKLARSEAAFASAAQRLTTTDYERARIAADAQASKVALAAELAKSVQLSRRLQEQEGRLASLNEELSRLGSVRVADEVLIAAQQKQLNDLSGQLNAQAEALSSERQLLSAGRDVRELMGARNLHIVDVFDTDPRGNNRRAFGRVFLTEGKSLIFYAFDLSTGNVLNAKHSFQAWGLRDGGTASAKSLGIFYVDDAAQKRWVLKVQDPNLLSQIDAVFVTVEPFGGAGQPTGHRLLYAYLKQQPNHP